MVVKVEQGEICKQQIPLYDAALLEKTQQIEIATELGDKKFGECEKQRVAETGIYEAKDKARVQEIKDAGKTQWTLLFGGFGAGALLVGLLVILL